MKAPAAEDIWQRLEDPVDAALVRTGLTAILQEQLNGEDLQSGVEAWEYLAHYADASVAEGFRFASWAGLIAKEVPVIRLRDNCGWIPKPAEIAQIFVDPQCASLARLFSSWWAQHADALGQRLLAAYAQGGDHALKQAAYGEIARTEGQPQPG